MTLPNFNWESARHVLSPAFTIALLSSIESLLCARVADHLIGDRHDPAQELVGQGIANLVAPLFGGFCATGTIARTIANVRSGAVTPIAGIVHSITLLLIVLLAAPLAQDIPLASLSAILLFVAYNMGEWEQFWRMKNFTMNYRIILVTTFVLTVVIDLTVAVEAGLLLSCLFFITRVNSLTHLEKLDSGLPDTEIFQLFGSLFFGSISKLDDLLDPNRPVSKVTILDLSSLLNMDTTGLEALEGFHELVEKQHGILLVCGAPKQPASLIHRSGFERKIGLDRIFATLEDAKAWCKSQS
jgi:SulP family sulfate permease